MKCKSNGDKRVGLILIKFTMHNTCKELTVIHLVGKLMVQ
jgi:hypothetical protein